MDPLKRKRLERERNDADVIEHVLGGTDDTRAQTEVTDLDVLPWLGGHVVSAVQVQVLRDHADRRGRRR